ncbi:flagellar motor protein MotB [Puniceibacterium sp. IMCC21224]|uniref:flagellar motor protein MotB n=1 Tax=Puniceibacterium sp. IMCC21224 TaxID=1618204 RepID=UPI00064DCD0F|nr:flagellar motor protein MotB [Puniceibacterium sp. IMCC21224]KMK65392.1 flagellar motor protein [Puniceibacterium sp. IMCC21224]
MGVGSNVAPVIIKRKKVISGGGHHGGAWKVAYADFVTAMMAFFLLMWLLNATTEKQRKGIADYFSPTIAISRVSGGGNGILGGNSTFTENTLPRMGTGATNLRPTSENRAMGADSAEGAAEEKDFRQLETLLMGRGGESMVADELLQHIVTKVTDEGLVIELFETESGPLFQADGQPTRLMENLSDVLVRVSAMVTNPVAVEAHVRAVPIVLAKDPTWDRSAQNAAKLRDLLTEKGLADRRIARVTAHADREPVTRNHMDIRNSRIEVIYLRRF